MKANHVVVIGGGIGGMCAARVLSDHFERVTLIERDEFPKAPRIAKACRRAVIRMDCSIADAAN